VVLPAENGPVTTILTAVRRACALLARRSSQPPHTGDEPEQQALVTLGSRSISAGVGGVGRRVGLQRRWPLGAVAELPRRGRRVERAGAGARGVRRRLLACSGCARRERLGPLGMTGPAAPGWGSAAGGRGCGLRLRLGLRLGAGCPRAAAQQAVPAQQLVLGEPPTRSRPRRRGGRGRRRRRTRPDRTATRGPRRCACRPPSTAAPTRPRRGRGSPPAWVDVTTASGAGTCSTSSAQAARRRWPSATTCSTGTLAPRSSGRSRHDEGELAVGPAQQAETARPPARRRPP
jgi:hypothetical protein